MTRSQFRTQIDMFTIPSRPVELMWNRTPESGGTAAGAADGSGDETRSRTVDREQKGGGR